MSGHPSLIHSPKKHIAGVPLVRSRSLSIQRSSWDTAHVLPRYINPQRFGCHPATSCQYVVAAAGWCMHLAELAKLVDTRLYLTSPLLAICQSFPRSFWTGLLSGNGQLYVKEGLAGTRHASGCSSCSEHLTARSACSWPSSDPRILPSWDPTICTEY